MKKLKALIILFVSLCFIAGLSTIALAEQPPVVKKSPQITISKPPPVPLFICPTGWEKVPGPDLKCRPKKPAPIKCPKGYTYYEKLKCTATTFFGGCQAEGCEVGCFKPPEPPK